MEVRIARLLDLFPSLQSQIIRYDSVLPHSLEEWENKMDPALFELGKMSGLEKRSAFVDGKEILFQGNDAGLLRFISDRGQRADFKKPDLFLYGFQGLNDLAILRRMKEYPDETSRVEIEAYWLAECVEAKSLIVVNSNLA